MASVLYKEFVETHSAWITVLILRGKNFAWAIYAVTFYE